MTSPTASPMPRSRRETVLRAAAGSRWAEEDAARQTLLAALEWGHLHVVDGGRLPTGCVLPGTDAAVRLGGSGTPRVADSCVAELGAALRVSTDAARYYLADALEVAHRLPAVFARLTAGEVVVWRARALSRLTIPLAPGTAAVVDARIAPFLPKLSAREIKRYVAAIVAETAPAELGAAGTGSPDELAADTRHVTFTPVGAGHPGDLHGLVHLDADLDLLDASYLETAIDTLVEEMRTAGAEEPTDLLRARALGEIGSRDLRLRFPHPGQEPDVAATSATPMVTPSAAQRTDVTLVVHLDPDHPLVATLDTPGHRDQPVLTDVVREWCAGADAEVTVKPVIDTRKALASAGYTPSPRLRELVLLRERTCVFPHCHRPSAVCDLDHITPYSRGGTTCTGNLAPLCRRHHRLKTHHGWTYTPLDPDRPPGTYLWRTPTGELLLRTPFGTTSYRPPGPPLPGRIPLPPQQTATPAA